MSVQPISVGHKAQSVHSSTTAALVRTTWRIAHFVQKHPIAVTTIIAISLFGVCSAVQFPDQKTLNECLSRSDGLTRLRLDSGLLEKFAKVLSITFGGRNCNPNDPGQWIVPITHAVKDGLGWDWPGTRSQELFSGSAAAALYQCQK